MGHMANRLSDATSPYLLQHADNPVDWWEWGPDAFAEARRRGVPVLLSVGYAACHWCHVMAHESFEDDATAAYLNEHFVSVKVDREERPDVDAVYMEATTAMTGHGGWPMTCVLDHDGRAVLRRHLLPGPAAARAAVLPAGARGGRRRVDETAATTYAGSPASSASTSTAQRPPRRAPSTRRCCRPRWPAWRGDFDEEHAGFGTAPKFPPSMVLELLLRVSTGSRTGDAGDARRMLDATLQAMARGGIYDQLGGGFARYAVDRAWVVPHFEKMLYDNAQLIGVYARSRRAVVAPHRPGHRGLRDPRARHRARAASPPRWTPTARAWRASSTPGRRPSWSRCWARTTARGRAERFEVTEAGTFEHGTSTLQLLVDPDDTERLASVRERLLAARAERVRPARDDKVVAAWNGLAISGLCDLAVRTDEPRYLAAAVAAGELLVDVHLDGGRLLRVSRDGRAGPHAGVLEDHGCVASGFLSLLQATGDPRWLTRADAVLEVALTHFRAEDGGFHDTADDAEALVARPRDPSDNASPSGLSATVHALAVHAALTGSGRHRDGGRGGARHHGRAGRAGAALRRVVAGRGGRDARGTARDRRGGPAGCRARRVGQGRPPRPRRGGRGRGGVTGGARDPAAHRTDDRRRCPRGVRLSSPGLRASRHRPGGPARWTCGCS